MNQAWARLGASFCAFGGSVIIAVRHSVLSSIYAVELRLDNGYDRDGHADRMPI